MNIYNYIIKSILEKTVIGSRDTYWLDEAI